MGVGIGEGVGLGVGGGVRAGEAAGAAISGLPLSGGRGSVSPAGALSAGRVVSAAGVADRAGTGAGVGTAGTGVGLGVLWVLSFTGGVLGLRLGVNLVNALVLGVLGAPGLGLLAAMNWALAG